MPDETDPVRGGEETKTMELAHFKHHPDPSTDFCMEVEDLQGYAHEVSVGLNLVPGHRSQWPFWGRLSRLLRFVRAGQADAFDEIAQRAREIVPTLEPIALSRPEVRHADA